MKAKYLGKVKDRNGYAVHLFYEYRGLSYMITDEHNGYSETIMEKHRYEQDLIDARLDRKEENASGKGFDPDEIFYLLNLDYEI